MFYVFIIIIICIALCMANSMLDFTPQTSNVFRFSEPPTKNCTRPCPRNISYVCGSNGKTYVNSCSFDIANCQTGGKLTFKPGKCPPKGPNTTLSPPTTNCTRLCPTNINSDGSSYVCGSDGITYPTLCHFDNANCQAGGILESKPGSCPGIYY